MILDALFDDHATTDGVIVRVVTNFLDDQSSPSQNRWFWSYHIRIENHRDDPVQLLTRHGKIADGHGGVHPVDGDGVVRAGERERRAVSATSREEPLRAEARRLLER